MKAHHFCVMGIGPEGDIRPRIEKTREFKKSQSGEWILWDGKADKAEILRMFRSLAPYFKRIQVFKGADVGKLIFDSNPNA